MGGPFLIGNLVLLVVQRGPVVVSKPGHAIGDHTGPGTVGRRRPRGVTNFLFGRCPMLVPGMAAGLG